MRRPDVEAAEHTSWHQEFALRQDPLKSFDFRSIRLTVSLRFNIQPEIVGEFTRSYGYEFVIDFRRP